MANRLNVVIGADINELKKGFDEAIKVVQSSGSKMSGSVAEAAKDIQSRLDALASKRPTARVVRELQTLAMETRAMGPQFSAMADQFVMAAGKMQDEIGDTRAQIGYFASDTRRLDAVLGGAQAIAAGFGVVQGSMAAMGVESEDLQKTMAKLQGVMVLLNSLQTIQNALQTESALVQGILAAANGTLTTSITATVSAMSAMRIALVSLGIGAAVVAVAALVSAYQDYQKETKQAAKEQEKWNNISKNTTENFKKDYEQVSSFVAVLNDANASYKDRAEAVKRIQEIYPNFLKNQSLEQLGAEGVKKATSDLTNEIYKSAKAKAAYNEIAAISAKLFEVERKKAADQAYWQGQINKLYAQGRADLVGNAQQSMAVNAKKFDTQIKGYQDEIKQIEKYITTNQLAATAVVASNKKIAESSKKEKQGKSYAPALVVDKFEIRSDKFEEKIKELNKIRFAYMMDVIPTINPTRFQADMAAATQEINKQFEQMLESITTSFGEALGNMLSGQDGAFQNFGKKALTAIAEFMKMVGQALIATAIASDAFKKMLLTNPIGAAAAGVALVAGATIIKNKLEKGPEFTAFADGGIVSGPTFALMGEYPNARTNPEVIAPLDKLQKLIGTSSQGSNDSFIASTRISGRDLSIVLERYKQDNSRG